MKNTHAQRICSATPPPSGRKPQMNLAPRDVEGLLEQLQNYHAEFAPLFQRTEQRHHALLYMQGQMLELERKSIEPMARALKAGDVQALQQFTSVSPWCDDAIIQQHHRQVAITLGRPEGVVIIDGCDFPKQGEESVGVIRQYCGALGKIANCQASVLLAYASDAGYTLLDRRLYMPEVWFTPEYETRRQACGVPEELTFQTKNALCWEMLEALFAAQVLPFQWVTMDEAYGRDSTLLDRIAQRDKYYFAEIPRSITAWQRRPKVLLPTTETDEGRARKHARLAPTACAAMRVEHFAQKLPAQHWRRVIVHESTKGPVEAELAIMRLTFSDDGLPGREDWAIFRRTSAQQPQEEWKFFRSNATADTPWEKLAEMAAWRWPIESAIEECKGELGMDHYEVRNWRGWHHHMTMTMLSHHFLVRVRVNMGEQAPALTVSQVRKLLQVILPKIQFDAETMLQEIQRTQKQNYAAYRSHRKRRRQKSRLPT